MDTIVLSDEGIRDDLFPFTLTRSAADIRVGILSIREKWEMHFGFTVLNRQQDKEIPQFPTNLIPDDNLVEAIQLGRSWAWISSHLKDLKILQYPWHIFQFNGSEIINDFKSIIKNRISQPLSGSNRVVDAANIFVEQGALVENAILNAREGPIYIGHKAEIMDGAIIKGPFALCEGSLVKMGATIYGSTTVGPYSVVGGEIKNSVFLGYSNKAHHGYLGDSVIGEWCNLGAGSSNSNIRNNAGPVKVWNDTHQQFYNAGQKCGLFMGDYSRAAINTSFNTGTVTGVSCNIFGHGLTPRYIPSFSWGLGGCSPYEIERALEDIDNWKKLKNGRITDIEIRTLKHIFDQISKPR